MEAAPPNPPRNPTTTILPPRRGRVKAQIFESLAENLSSAVSKAGQALAKLKGGSSAASATSASTSTSTSTSTSPLPSIYTSNGYPDQAPEP